VEPSVVLAEQRLAYPLGADADQKLVIAEAMRAAVGRRWPIVQQRRCRAEHGGRPR
jgi:hypothetical protein